ncbi:hypothetical protein EV645_8265 [Kribbella rubisoli]|uniref:DUF2268 domain-containing protein n=1 Tax=Kribbella rubisoli TaxID=3075929 RepID=A0A4Q7VXG8_9ACTN|nr:hypothetical protein [Kribbella rubisoli]RZU01434.1 hypothetical protein EV645_8265 [Kribbella rubisoli]
MSVTVRDLVPAFIDFWASADRPWDEYIEKHPDVLNDLTRSGRTLQEAQREKTFAAYEQFADRIRANAPHATRWIEQAADRVVPLLDAGHIDIDGVAMVGLATSNGWVAGGTLYLAVELIPDERGAEILGAHEIAHALQAPLPEQPWPDEGPLGEDIYSEGFATALTAELFPQYTLAEHLWFGPGYDDWLADCQRQEAAARAAILGNLDSEDDDVIRRFLTLSGKSEFPQRIGYYVGTRLIQDLRREHSWPDLARWSTARAMHELRAWLTNNDPDDAGVPR